jgi:hypothetical protein
MFLHIIFIYVLKYKADITIMYRNAINQVKSEYYGKNLKNLNKLVNMGKSMNKKKSDLSDQLKKEKVNKEAWKNAFVPLYFESEWGQNFLNNLTTAAQNKENIFFQTSEHDFVNGQNNNNASNDQQTSDKIQNQTQLCKNSN